jgi:hypothetical protein
VRCRHAVILCLTAGAVLAHGKHDRLHEVVARTRVTVEPSRILLVHEQTYSAGMSRFVCTEMDKDGDTRIAPAEVERWAKQMAKQIPERCPLEVDWQTLKPASLAQDVKGAPATVPVTDTAAPEIRFRLDATYRLEVPPGVHLLELLLGATAAYSSRTDLAFVAPARALSSHAGELAAAGDTISNYVQIDGQPPRVSCVFSTSSGSPGVRPGVGALIGVGLFALGLAAGRRRGRLGR